MESFENGRLPQQAANISEEPAAGEISLTQNAGLVGLSKLVSIFGLLVASMVLTRLLSRSEYGNYEQVWLVYNSFLPLLVYGISSGIYFFSAREDTRSVYSAAAVGTSIVGIITGVIFAVLAPAISRLFNADQITVYIRIFAVYCIVSSSSLMFEAVFVNEKKVGLLLLGNTIVSILFGGMVALSALKFHSLTAVFISITIVGGVKSLYLFSFLIKSHKLTTHRILPVMKMHLFYALPIFS